MFFALKGENFNGNTFASQAIEMGASYVVIDEEKYAKDERYILVHNVLQTLQELATFHRKYLSLPILAITGSNGKTTSKELIHAVLKQKYNTMATAGNFNNHIGVPLTLLSFGKETEFGIVEMGANHPGEIKMLCEIALPDYGYITNFGKAHLEGFGSIEGVIKAKSELYEHLIQNSKLIFINLDDPLQKEKTSYPNTYCFGKNENTNVQFTYAATAENVEVKQGAITYTSQLSGNYNAANIAAAICIGTYYKVAPEIIQEAIATYSPQNNRSQIINMGSIQLLMDAYNANPTSMRAAIESFQNHPFPNKMLILGDMFELGEDAHKEHQEIVTLLEQAPFQKVYLAGSNFYDTTSTASHIKKFENYKELEKEIKNQDLGNSFILIKGSRGMALERIVDALKQKETKPG